MENTRREQILIVIDDSKIGLRSNIEHNYELLHSFSSRVFVVRGSSADLEILSKTEGVIAATTTVLDDLTLKTLAESEMQQIAAWVLGQSPKKRSGEGYPWDKEGFLPPDRKE